MFDRVLVANRGEIAVRVIRACHELGIEAVAVHSDADARAPHVETADASVRVGPAPAAESYLDQQAVIEAAQDTGAQAIHPGYGFLAENAGFAAAVGKAGLTWVGPTPEAMAALGDKVAARGLAIKEDVPVAAGSDGAVADADEALGIAEEIGFPVMIKAAAGGGGMGMRVARSADELPELFESARAQAEAAFGDGSIFVERFLVRPRHIEVQVVGDADGNVVHLFERECSIQRRHQKLLEEAPSPALDDEQRDHVGGLAVRLAEAGGYTNAGTMEFLFADGQFHFNEMNTRLQVEHPVTELVTGIDLVQTQLRVASDGDLGFEQADVQVAGHAIECRINAEDPYHGFRPSPGRVQRLAVPAGPGVRFDHGLREGWVVPGDYDSLVAKLIVHGPDRTRAIARTRRALSELAIEGFPTTRPFHEALLAHPDVAAGNIHTHFLDESGVVDGMVETARRRVAAAAAGLALAPRLGVGAWHARSTTPPERGGGA